MRKCLISGGGIFNYFENLQKTSCAAAYQGIMTIPKYDDLFVPLLQAMHNLGGSASIAEQEDEVTGYLHLHRQCDTLLSIGIT